MGIFGSPNVNKMMRNKDVEGLIKALDYQKEYQVRKNAAEALGQLGDALAFQPLIHALEDGNYSVRATAATALAEIDNVRALKPLATVLKDKEKSVRMAAVNALAQIDNERAVKLLIGALDDRESEIRKTAMNGLTRFGPSSVEWLITTLVKKEYYDVEYIATALGQIGASRAVEPLIAVLSKGYYMARKAAAIALGKIGDSRAVEPLIGALKDKDFDVCRSARDALIQIGFPSIDMFIAALKEGFNIPHENAAIVLEQIGNTQAVETLVAVLRGDDKSTVEKNLRKSVAKILVSMYKNEMLEEPLRKFILDQREIIISHSDRIKEKVEVVVKGGCATVVKEHHDTGIGVDFPL